MKKTIATLLALTTILTISLTACGDRTTHGNDSESDDTEDLFLPPVGSDTNDTETDDTGVDTKDTEGEWETISYTVYAMGKINLRSEASQKSEKAGTVDMGTALSVVARNDNWLKLSYNSGTAYVNREHVTNDKDECTFEACENTTLKIKDNGDAEHPYTVNLRTAPIIVEDTLGDSIDHTDTANGELIKIAENKAGNWFKVKYTVDGEPGEYYIKMTSAIKGYFGLSSGGNSAIG